MTDVEGAAFLATGVVQGVGFRPFVYGLATRLGLTGWVRNTSAGVQIVADGPGDALAAFAQALRSEAPPVARIDELIRSARSPNGFTRFEIVPSSVEPAGPQPVPPDIAVCGACLRELFDPGNRRYRYPFINCTHCGPRFTIIQAMPYDRPATTMARFSMCAACAAEYTDPGNRRFHAQPIACPECGPQLWLEVFGSTASGPRGERALQAARELLRAGGIVAVKGLGGFHLACDAQNPAAVTELRRRKLRGDKPFAVMVTDTTMAAACCRLTPAEAALLSGREHPIVILERCSGSPIAEEAAPGQQTLGLMLPYTPLHHLLLQQAAGFPPALVMTSGNLCQQPLIVANEAARAQLSGLADALLMHDRLIHARCDDSVMRVFSGVALRPPAPQLIRRARGLAPAPVPLPFDAVPLLATGAELKNTFCLASGRAAFLSQHMGDLENYETLAAFEAGVAHFEQLFRCHPRAFACDLHPDLISTRYAEGRAQREARPLIRVQHHHGHLAACLADNGVPGDRPVLGVIFDGTGYGDDGAIWGGEFLVGGYAGCTRRYHLAYAPLLGGEAAIREPWRMALAWLNQAGLQWAEVLPPVAAAGHGHSLDTLQRQLRARLNTPPTSSMGRLFDAVAALIGLRERVTYEAQAAIELEAQADWSEADAYSFDFDGDALDPRPVIRHVVADWQAGVAPGRIAARFHIGLAQAVCRVAMRVRDEHDIRQVALSGGVWQNQSLLHLTLVLLERAGFGVLCHKHVPPNDGGLALGQAAVAASRQAAGG